MPRSTINFDTVRNIGLRLPGVEESTAYGQPALKIHGKLLACLPAHLSRVNPDCLRGLLRMAHKFVTRNAASRLPARKRRKLASRK